MRGTSFIAQIIHPHDRMIIMGEAVSSFLEVGRNNQGFTRFETNRIGNLLLHCIQADWMRDHHWWFKNSPRRKLEWARGEMVGGDRTAERVGLQLATNISHRSSSSNSSGELVPPSATTAMSWSTELHTNKSLGILPPTSSSFGE
jgi:hypothetical protein